jgi:hypothetical protein
MKGFSIAKDGSLSPPIDSAEEGFSACNSTLRGVEQLALKFGVYKADGCARIYVWLRSWFRNSIFSRWTEHSREVIVMDG